MELYHNNMAVCAQKVRLMLAEKGLQPIKHHLTLRKGDARTPEYLKLNPNGVVPTLIDRGAVIIESTVICEYLEDAYPDPPTRPADPVGRARMRVWTQVPDTSVHQACGVLSIGIALRHQMLAAGGAQFANRPNKDGRASIRIDVVEKGLESEHVPMAVRVYDAAIARMAAVLSSQPWLAGDDYSLADIAMLPYVCRLEDLSLDWFWEGPRAAVADWLARAKARPNFHGIADYREPEYAALMAAKGREATTVLRDLLKAG